MPFGAITSLGLARVRRTPGRPYALEVVGDPDAVFAPDVIRHPLRPLLRWWFSRELRRQCAGAAAAVYVTNYALQRKYPCPRYSAGVSDVLIPHDALATQPRARNSGRGPLRLVMVGTMDQMYKAHDLVLNALSLCVREGLDLHLTLVGDGRFRPALQEQAARLGIDGRTRFAGQLPPDRVRAELDAADLFLMPSRTEGLPRALIEAMARGLPCIGSTVGGIPELLAAEDMVPPGDEAALTAKLREVVSSSSRMEQMAARNLAKAQEYRIDRLKERRLAFYRHVRDVTAQWQRAGNSRCSSAGQGVAG